MYQAFETDVMDDLFYDQVEGPAQRGDYYDSYDAGDEFGEYDLAEADDDAFIGGLIRGIGSMLGSGQGFDEMEDWGEQGYDSGCPKTTGTPVSPPSRRAISRGTHPSKGMPNSCEVFSPFYREKCPSYRWPPR